MTDIHIDIPVSDEPVTPITANTYPQPPISGYGENNGHAPVAAPPVEVPAERVPRADGKISCTVCGGWVKPTYMQAHMVKMHDMGRKREFKPRPASRGKKTGASKPGPKPKAKATHPAVIEPGLGKQTPVPEPAEEPLTVDGILATLVELRWPVSMPTRKVLEMADVRAVLQRFLA